MVDIIAFFKKLTLADYRILKSEDPQLLTDLTKLRKKAIRDRFLDNFVADLRAHEVEVPF